MRFLLFALLFNIGVNKSEQRNFILYIHNEQQIRSHYIEQNIS
jgi:hypothetical protein